MNRSLFLPLALSTFSAACAAPVTAVRPASPAPVPTVAAVPAAVRGGELCVGPWKRTCFGVSTLLEAKANAEAPESVLAELSAACRAQDAAACNDAAVLYAVGRGAAEDQTRANALFAYACSAHVLDACTNLGRQYRSGRAADAGGLALRTFVGTCQLGSASACFEAGEMMVVAGREGPRTVELYDRACDGGYGRACGRVAYRWGVGLGVAPDAARAFARAERGCALGDKTACAEVGSQLEVGSGAPRDEGRAFLLLQKTCTEGGAAACVQLGRIYERGGAPGLDGARAATLYKTGCDKLAEDSEGAQGCYFLGLLYRDGRLVAKDVKEGVTLLARACDMTSHALACNELGLMYHTGALVPHDQAKAVRLFERSCNHGGADGCTNLGASYLLGEGVASDRVRATRLFKYACARGASKACTDLTVFGEAEPVAKADVKL